MSGKDRYQYSSEPIGVPSVLLAAGWVSIWLLWPSFRSEPDVPRRGQVNRCEVSYGAIRDSLYMSPFLFARSTRVGFRAPERDAEELALDNEDALRPRMRFLHVRPPDPDFAGMRVDAGMTSDSTKRVDGYRPVWKDESVFAAAETTNAVVVEIGRALMDRQYAAAALEWPPEPPKSDLEVEAFVEVAVNGVVADVLVERGSGSPAVDAAVVRALGRGRATPGDDPAFGRVRVTLRPGVRGRGQ